MVKSSNKRFYWIKLKTNFFNLDEIDFLLSQKNGCEYIVLYQMLCLNTANTNGNLETKIGEMIVPYDVNKIVRDTKYFDFDTVMVALDLYRKLGLIYEDEKGTLKISNYDEMIGSEAGNPNAQRQKRFREKQKKLKESVTENNVESNGINNDLSVTENNEEYRDKSIEYRDIDIRDKNIENTTTTMEVKKILKILKEHKIEVDENDEIVMSSIKELFEKGYKFVDLYQVIIYKCNELKNQKILTAFNILNPKYFSYNLDQAEKETKKILNKIREE